MSFLSDAVKDAVDMPAVARMYGFEPNRGGFISCPLHDERTASLKVYDGKRGWYCFGCNRGGSVVDFVMAVFGLSFPAALDRLNTDFHLGLADEKPAPAEIARVKAERAKKERERAEFEAESKQKSLEYRRLWKRRAPEDMDRLAYLDYWFDTHPFGRW